MKSKYLFVLLVLFFGIFSTAYRARAEAPVVNLSEAGQTEASIGQGLEIDQEEPVSPNRVPVNHQNEPMEQRVLRLERQMSNMNEVNYASKLEKMQQEVQQLHGQIEVLSHNLAQLKEQTQNFYQDLDQRLSKKSSISSNTGLEKNAPTTTEKNMELSEESTATVDTTKTKELQTYEMAFNLLNKKEYEKAITGFQNFIKMYPTSTYTVNAHYWLGEIYYLKDKPQLATGEFQIIVNSYPDSPKVADALLKIALIAMDAGNYTKARQNLIKVQKQYPGSTAAKIATLRLKEIKQKK